MMSAATEVSRAQPEVGPDEARREWRRGFVAFLVVADALSVPLGATLAFVLGRSGGPIDVLPTSMRMPYAGAAALIAALWLATLGLSRVYNSRVLGAGSDEYRRIVNAAVRLVAGLAALVFFVHLTLSRSYVVVVAPVMVLWTLVAHWGARKYLHRRRRAGVWKQRTVVVGAEDHVAALVDHLRQFTYVGFDIVGACTGMTTGEIEVKDATIPVVAPPADLVSWLKAGGAEAVIVADAAVLGVGALRRFAWQIEGLGIDLIVAPSVTGVAGPRIAVRPVEGLPLLHLEEPRFDGVTRVVKGVVERTAALLALLALSPLLAVIALAVKLTSPGPVFYRQTRVGRAGEYFRMYKFRTMVEGADRMRVDLDAHNEHGDDPLFKMRDDPRVTRVGRTLRRFSLDELPQLAHVVTGRMAVVGPRPPLPEEVAQYTDEAWRRLLVRPGITGLWQVSGRSTLPWMETLRLDLFYVDNWSLALDLIITLKTFNAVLRGRGAY